MVKLNNNTVDLPEQNMQIGDDNREKGALPPASMARPAGGLVLMAIILKDST